jgi:hypothetical protein
MSRVPSTIKNDSLRITLWAVLLPPLACWPMLSALPAFSLLAGWDSPILFATYFLLAITGFWGVLAVFIALPLLQTEAARAQQTAIRGEKGLMLAAYAAIWTLAYGLFAWATR